MTTAPELPVVDADEIRRVLDDYYARGWTDGLPVMPVTESILAEFLAQTTRDPDEVLLAMPHLNRDCTVRLAAINAAMAGCLPEYFPVVVAAWSALNAEGYVPRAIWQSTTGTASILLVNGPIRERIGLNSRGNVFGSGFRANATIGRAIRLTAINAFGLRPGELDQATQGNPAKYSACIAENEEESPWPAFHVEHGFDSAASTVTAMTMRSVAHIEARHTQVPSNWPGISPARSRARARSSTRRSAPASRSAPSTPHCCTAPAGARRICAALSTSTRSTPARRWPRSARTPSRARHGGGCPQLMPSRSLTAPPARTKSRS